MKKLMIFAVLISGMLISAEGFAQSARGNKGNHKVVVENRRDKGGFKVEHKGDKKGDHKVIIKQNNKHKDNHKKHHKKHHNNHVVYTHHHHTPVVVHRPAVHVVHHDNDVADAVVAAVSLVGLISLLAD